MYIIFILGKGGQWVNYPECVFMVNSMTRWTWPATNSMKNISGSSVYPIIENRFRFISVTLSF